MRNLLKILFVSCLCTVLAVSCAEADEVAPEVSEPVSTQPASFAKEWMELVQKLVRDEGQPPPVAARTYAYSAIALYEAVVPGMPEYRSLGKQAWGMPGMPLPPENLQIDWPAAAAGAAGTTISTLFADPKSHVAINELMVSQLSRRSLSGVREQTLERSRLYGVEVAQVLNHWSAGDGMSDHAGRTYAFPVGDRAWVPTKAGMEPLLPYWSSMRPFALPSADACAPQAPPEFSIEPMSELYLQAKAVHDASVSMDDKKKAIAKFWSDDPGLTSTPHGHWISIATSMIERFDLKLDRTVEMYALVGIVGADAFISCWDEKYRSNLLRPVTYIERHIQPGWQPLLNTPPFPEYTSGHSNVSGASAAVLTELFGDNVAFVDKFGEDRGLPARTFNSFSHAAEEAAISRLYGGIHYPIAIERGMPQGACVADHLFTRVQTRR